MNALSLWLNSPENAFSVGTRRLSVDSTFLKTALSGRFVSLLLNDLL